MPRTDFFSPFRKTASDKLIVKARNLSRELDTREAARASLKTAKDRARLRNPNERWEMWRDLIDVHRRCERQIRILKSAEACLSQAATNDLDWYEYLRVLRPLESLLEDEASRENRNVWWLRRVKDEQAAEVFAKAARESLHLAQMAKRLPERFRRANSEFQQARSEFWQARTQLRQELVEPRAVPTVTSETDAPLSEAEQTALAALELAERKLQEATEGYTEVRESRNTGEELSASPLADSARHFWALDSEFRRLAEVLGERARESRKAAAESARRAKDSRNKAGQAWREARSPSAGSVESPIGEELLEAERSLQEGHERLRVASRAFEATDRDLQGAAPKGRKALSVLAREVEGLKSAWLLVRGEVTRARPNVSIVHAFLRVSQISAVEVASVLGGGLVLVGAIYTEAFYQAAIGTSVWTYFTLEDLLDQGVRGLRHVALVLLGMEVSLWCIQRLRRRRRPRRAFALHWLVLERPVALFLVVAVVTALATLGSGWLRGSVKRDNFFRMKPVVETQAERESRSGSAKVRDLIGSVGGWFIGWEDATVEVATVSDGTVLRDVHLVGMTSRTATFLQACNWEKPRPSGVEVALEICERKAWEPDPRAGDAVVRGRILTMDRGLVVCHARGNACTDQGERNASINDRMTELEGALGGLARRDELMHYKLDLAVFLERHHRTLDEHLNRHHSQVLKVVRRIGSGSGRTGRGEVPVRE